MGDTTERKTQGTSEHSSEEFHGGQGARGPREWIKRGPLPVQREGGRKLESKNKKKKSKVTGNLKKRVGSGGDNSLYKMKKRGSPGSDSGRPASSGK